MSFILRKSLVDLSRYREKERNSLDQNTKNSLLARVVYQDFEWSAVTNTFKSRFLKKKKYCWEWFIRRSV